MAHELAAAVDLDGEHGRGEGLDDGVEEAPGVEGGGAGEGHVVDLDELAGAIGLVAVLPAPRPAVEPAAAPGLDPAFADAGEGHDAGGDGAREDAPDGGHAQAQALAFEHALDRRLAHERMLAAQIQDGLHVARLARPAPNAARAGGLRRQAALAARGQRGLPPIHRPAADADLPRGGLFRAAGCAQFVVPADRRQALAGLGRQAGVVDLEIAVRSRPHRFDLHGSGLHSVGFAFTEGYPIRRRWRVFRRRRRLGQSRPGQCQIYLNQHRPDKRNTAAEADPQPRQPQAAVRSVGCVSAAESQRGGAACCGSFGLEPGPLRVAANADSHVDGGIGSRHVRDDLQGALG